MTVSNALLIQMRMSLLLFFLAAAMFLASPAHAENVMDIVNSRSELSMVKGLISGLNEFSQTLSDGASKVTIFLPHNDAFNGTITPRGWYNEMKLSANKDKLIEALQYITHLSMDTVYTKSTLKQEAGTAAWKEVTTLLARDRYLFYSTIEPGYVNGAKVLTSDVVASNGVVHIVDRFFYGNVGYPHAASTHISPEGEWSGSDALFTETIKDYHEQNDFGSSLDAFYAMSHHKLVTLFYPTNKALTELGPQWRKIKQDGNKLLRQELVESHVIPKEVLHTGFVINDLQQAPDKRYGSFYGTYSETGKNDVQFQLIENELYVTSGCTQAKIIRANITVNNGVIHVIDGVLGIKQESIIDVISNDDNLRTFETHLSTSNVKDQIVAGASSGSSFTVFAPVDSAWGSLDLTQDIQKLSQAMMMHVVKHNGDDVLQLGSVQIVRPVTLSTLAGVEAKLTRSQNGNVYVEVNGVRARIEPTGSICTTNGVVYKVNQVLGMASRSAISYLTNSQDDNGNPMFDEFVRKVDLSGLRDTLLSANERLTVFAPTDAAFNKMRLTERGRKLYDMGTEDIKHQLNNVIKRHILNDQVVFFNSTLSYPYEIREGVTIQKRTGIYDYYIGDGYYYINITLPNINLTNGVLHIVDGLMYHEDPSLDASVGSSDTCRMTLWLLFVAALSSSLTPLVS